MTYKELILSTIRGEPVDKLPFVPRLDLWYKANKLNGTLPQRYKNASLMEITQDLGVGYHGVIPDYRDLENDADDEDNGLALYRFRAIPYKFEFHNIERRITRNGGLTAAEYSTPYGKITVRFRYDESMKRSGITLPYIIEHAVKKKEDFKACAYIFENIHVKPSYEGYERFRDFVGDNGAAVAFNSPAASPMHLILKELMSIEDFFYESIDYPDEMEELAAGISKFYEKVFDIVADCPADIVMSGANYDSSITTPPFFRRHILPSLKKQADVLHSKGKYLLTHTDGENRGLVELYRECGFDIADSICPEPMTSLSLKEIMSRLEDRITIWGGIPSIAVLEESMSDYEFEAYLDKLLSNIGDGKHIIFSIADTTPPGAKFERIKLIAEKIREFGSVK